MKQIFRILLQKEFQPIVSWFDVDGWGKQFIIKLCEGETRSVFNLAKKKATIFINWQNKRRRRGIESCEN